jgi:hypothetical protein
LKNPGEIAMESLRDNAMHRRISLPWRLARSGALIRERNGGRRCGLLRRFHFQAAVIFEPLLFSSFPVHAHLTCVCAWIVVDRA